MPSRSPTNGSPTPTLVDRFARGLPLAEPDPATFYTGGAKGYIDYTAFDEAEERLEEHADG